jgi:hypothetical protein
MSTVEAAIDTHTVRLSPDPPRYLRAMLCLVDVLTSEGVVPVGDHVSWVEIIPSRSKVCGAYDFIVHFDQRDDVTSLTFGRTKSFPQMIKLPSIGERKAKILISFRAGRFSWGKCLGNWGNSKLRQALSDRPMPGVGVRGVWISFRVKPRPPMMPIWENY